MRAFASEPSLDHFDPEPAEAVQRPRPDTPVRTPDDVEWVELRGSDVSHAMEVFEPECANDSMHGALTADRGLSGWDDGFPNEATYFVSAPAASARLVLRLPSLKRPAARAVATLAVCAVAIAALVGRRIGSASVENVTTSSRPHLSSSPFAAAEQPSVSPVTEATTTALAVTNETETSLLVSRAQAPLAAVASAVPSQDSTIPVSAPALEARVLALYGATAAPPIAPAIDPAPSAPRAEEPPRVEPVIAVDRRSNAAVEAPASVSESRSVAPVPAATAAAIERRAVDTVLERYRVALSTLDTDAARAVWPTTDARALARAFGQLETQQLAFDSCEVSISGAQADADCYGRMSYVPRVGNKTTRMEARRWRFRLVKVEQDWLIQSVSAR